MPLSLGLTNFNIKKLFSGIPRNGLDRIDRIDHQHRNRCTYNIAAVFPCTGMSLTGKSLQASGWILINRNPDHRLTPDQYNVLSIDLIDLDFGKHLSVSVFLMIAGFSLVLVDNHFFRTAIGNNGSFNRSILYSRITYF